MLLQAALKVTFTKKKPVIERPRAPAAAAQIDGAVIGRMRQRAAAAARRAVQFCAIKSRLCLCSWLWLVISLEENHGAYFLSFLSLFFRILTPA